MSRHREAVRNLVEGVAAAVTDAVTDEVAQRLTSERRFALALSPLAPDPGDVGALTSVAGQVHDWVRAAQIAELRDLQVEIELAPRERIGRCVAGEAVTSRRFVMVDVRVKARLQTRWVDMFAERQATRQWAVA